MALKSRILRKSSNVSFGDGKSMAANTGYYVDRLLKPSISPVTIDGMKTSMLGRSFQSVQQGGLEVLNFIGHPKNSSLQSIIELEKFLTTNPELPFVTFQHFSTRKSLLQK